MEMIFNIIIYFTECLSFFIPTTETEKIPCMLKCVIIMYPKGKGVREAAWVNLHLFTRALPLILKTQNMQNTEKNQELHTEN